MRFIWVSMCLEWTSNWWWDHHFTLSSEPHKGLAAYSAKEEVSSYLTLSISMALVIER